MTVMSHRGDTALTAAVAAGTATTALATLTLMAGTATARTRGYLEHLSLADVDWLAARARRPGEAHTDAARRVREHVGVLEATLADPATEQALMPADLTDAEPLVRASPFLLFAVLVHRVHARLATAHHLEEWVGPRQRVPVFAAGHVAELLDDGWHRLFLAELLASYTHVASGAMTVTGPGGRRQRRRISELDPRRLVELLQVMPESQHAGVYRRLGDVALFLTGVFPDHTATQLFRDVEVRQLAAAVPDDVTNSAGAQAGDGEGLAEAMAARGNVGLLEHLGAHWYRSAERAGAGAAGTGQALPAMAERFGDARRVLNVLADRYLFPRGAGGGAALPPA